MPSPETPEINKRSMQEEFRDPSTSPERREMLVEAMRKAQDLIEFLSSNNFGPGSFDDPDKKGSVLWSGTKE